MDHSNNKKSGVCECMCLCMGMMLFISAVASFIAAFVVWIMALINGKDLDITDTCPNNMLWEWLLVWGIFTFINAGQAKTKKKDGETNVCSSLCVYIILLGSNIALCWWGRREIDRDNGCIEHNYSDTIFYNASSVFWWFHFALISTVLTIIAIVCVGSLFSIMMMSCKCGRLCMDKCFNKKSNDNDVFLKDSTVEFDLPDPLTESEIGRSGACSV